MTEKQKYLLLNVIKKNSSIKILIREELTFQRIAELTNVLIQDGLIILENNKVVLSELGLKILNELEVQFKKTNKEEWIQKDSKNIIQKLDKNAIFVPKQNELSFMFFE
jgi:predicted methyltransferase